MEVSDLRRRGGAKAENSLLLHVKPLCQQDHMRQVGEAQMEAPAFHLGQQRSPLKVLHVEILTDDNDPRRSKAPMHSGKIQGGREVLGESQAFCELRPQNRIGFEMSFRRVQFFILSSFLAPQSRSRAIGSSAPIRRSEGCGVVEFATFGAARRAFHSVLQCGAGSSEGV